MVFMEFVMCLVSPGLLLFAVGVELEPVPAEGKSPGTKIKSIS